MPIPSVRAAAIAALFSFLFSPPLLAQTPLQGKWECTTKSGQFDVNTAYNVHCAGMLHFKADRTLESTCSDGFFPSGVYWETHHDRLVLRDSGGKTFADFEIRKISDGKLLLARKGVEYAFQRPFSKETNHSGQ